MTAIPDEVIERVRDAADIVALVGEHVDLRRTGSDYRGPCPFHGGTHRNFAVIPRKQMFYCFVCHEGGDVFSFFMKKFGMEYPTAVREVARRVGITVPERATGGPDPREPLFGAVGVAAEWYGRRLQEGGDAEVARRYLADREVDLEKAALHGLGYAPPGRAFLEAMERLGIGEDVLREAGLAVRREDGSLRPRFWSRLLFPIRDLRGRTVGFGGRILGDGEPKYLNSSESPIFHKGSLLYNLHAARHPIRKADTAVLVEGYFDVLRLVEVGMENVVAPLGTALTGDQARLLRRYGTTVLLFYDSDTAGLRATFRAADELLRAGLRVLVATPPPGEDPDTLARRGGAPAVEAVFRDALDVLERKIQLLERKGWLGTLAGRRRALDRLLPTLGAPSDPVTRDLYVRRTAEALGVAVESVLREVEAAPSPRTRPSEPGTSAGRHAGAPSRSLSPEVQLLRLLVHHPEWRARISDHLRGLVAENGVESRLLRRVAEAGEGVSAGELADQLDGEEKELLLRVMAEGGEGRDVPHVGEEVAGWLARIEGRRREEKIAGLYRRMSVAAEEDKAALLREIDALVKQREIYHSKWKAIMGGRSRAR